MNWDSTPGYRQSRLRSEKQITLIGDPWAVQRAIEFHACGVKVEIDETVA